MARRTRSGDPTRDALDRAVGSQYEIIRLLGRGGMGAVYHAHEHALDRPVAIKVLPPDVAGTGDARERFLREARTAARLAHPNVVPLYTFGETAGLIYYVMGYVDGESLEARLQRTGRLDPAGAVRILEQLANALDHAHRLGIVHRDVKPDNVLIERGTGIAKLTDFGIARRAAAGDTLTRTGLVVGTPRYMSPEQASADELDARSDLYALGLVGYAMLTGAPPFDGERVEEILTKQLTAEPAPLRTQVPDAPAAAVRAIERALKKTPDERWPSAAAMAATLREEDDASGDVLRRLRRPGAYAVTFAAAGVVALNLAWQLAAFTERMEFMLGGGAGLLLGLLGDVALARWKDRRSAPELRRMLTQPPRWWPFWWPRRWRRADDVWHRLPLGARAARVCVTLGVASFALAAQVVLLRVDDAWLWGALSLSGFSVAMLIIASVQGWIWRRWRHVPAADARNMIGVSTSHPTFWTQPQIAARLATIASPMEDEPRTPRELADAIAETAVLLPTELVERVGDISSAARHLAAAVETLEMEIAALAREAGPTEVVRLQERIVELGVAGSTESDEKREIRNLYASKLDLVQRVEHQAAFLASRRAHYADLLKTLWTNVASLRRRAADAARLEDLSGGIRAICRQVEAESGPTEVLPAAAVPTKIA